MVSKLSRTISTQSEAKRNATVDITLARAAPATPISGKPYQPKIKKGSNTAFTIAEKATSIEGVLASPLALKIELPIKGIPRNKEPQ